MAWNNNGTGWCLQYTYEAFTSGDLKQYTRGGYMTADCDTTTSLDFSVVGCNGGATVGSWSRVLACNCPQ